MRPEIAQLFGEGRNYPTLATTPTSRKGRNIARDPRVAMSCVNFENPYITGRVRGRVVDTYDGDRAMEIVDRIAGRYIGADFPTRDMTVYVLEITHEEYNELPFQEPPS
jgi:hypothetical protein